MAVTSTTYAADGTITITLDNLAAVSGSPPALVGRSSAAVDNSSTLYLDALVNVNVTLVAGTPSDQKRVFLYVAGLGFSTGYTDNYAGIDASITLRDPTNLKKLGVLECPDAGGLLYVGGPFSVAQCFGGVMPKKWAIALLNRTGLALAADGNDASFRGITTTTA